MNKKDDIPLTMSKQIVDWVVRNPISAASRLEAAGMVTIDEAERDAQETPDSGHLHGFFPLEIWWKDPTGRDPSRKETSVISACQCGIIKIRQGSVSA